MRRLILSIIWMAVSMGFMNAADLLVEAESFSNKGGWAVDQQFMDLMGSSYLIAHGLGMPVADATTQVIFPEKGRYYVYVRTYNWTSPWDKGEGPGKFTLYVDNQKTVSPLGTDGSSWEWQAAGEVTVKDVNVTLRLRDLSGFDGRCDAIYFTTDRHAVPPSDVKDLEAFRHKKLNIPDSPLTKKGYDLVVVGAGIAGISAAVSAGRLGCRVALINDRPIIGGNNSSEIRVHLGGRINEGKYKNLGNLQKEFAPSKGGNAQPAAVYEDQKKMNWLANEKNVTLFANYRVIKVTKEDSKIASVIAKHIETGEEMEFKAPLFSDCTGDGTVGYLSGADYRMGRESKEEFNENIAPDKADKMTMGSSVQWYSVDNKKSCGFPEFDYGIHFNEQNCEKVMNGEWTWETGMNLNQITDFERIRDYGMLVVYSNWSFLKNHLKENSQYKNRKLAWVAYIAGKRESRRLMGDYILKEDDLMKNVSHEDASFTTTWSIDLHWPDPENEKKFPGDKAFKATTTHNVIHYYSVPYRCLYSRNVDNLFMAGRNISVTHVALGTVRVMRTTGEMGEVVGMAASICKEHHTTPRGVYQHYLDDLKVKMTEGVGNKELPNNQTYNEGGTLGDWKEENMQK
ncbi:MAG: FAD-dependent oxidoreductase [Phocaeicola sp.]|uniref:FAD-dependent oxidoreductase n=1 Tax=Phocaeicola sp. TaxID=2773926 RepID=UPI00234E9EBA|nr:FAD-dependent oxidoreductase [Phocaeicola oris]MCE2616073.1 FAD-dependent oxidoreductase [Phocaeicola oris]